MYTEGYQIGDNSYLLNDDDELVLATINGTPEQMEEYIQMVNNMMKKEKKPLPLGIEYLKSTSRI